MDQPLSNESLLSVRLVVGAGTHAGVLAEIREGIYMIGRDRECQIRPKSHSVSDRHCLVQHQSGVVRVFDLGSENGTFVNDDRLKPKTWRILNHSDRLRCGKYWFDVAIYLPESDNDADSLIDSVDDDLLSPATTGTEVAEADLFDDENFASDQFADSNSDTVDQDQLDSQTNKTVTDSTPSKTAKPRSRSLYSQLPKPKIKRGMSSGSGFSFGLPAVGSWKTLVAGLAMVSVIGYVGWSVYRIQKGPPVKILRGID